MTGQNEIGQGLMTTGGHLEVLRRMLFRIIAVIFALAVIIFCFKKETFSLLLAPKSPHFVTFSFIESILERLNIDSHFADTEVPLINTELSSQFMTHIYVSCLLAVLFASPYILFELFRFVSPALYEKRKKILSTGSLHYLYFVLHRSCDKLLHTLPRLIQISGHLSG